MSEKKESSKKLTRREFLRNSALLAGSAVVAGSILGNSTAEAIGRGPTPVPQTWDMEADVVVIGLGGAGACAAIEAHDAGSKVLVLEKLPHDTLFNNTRMSGGVWHNPDPTGDRTARIDYIKAMMSGENIPWKLEGEQPHVSDDMATMFADRIMEVEEFLMTLDPELDREAMAAGGDASFPMFPSFAEAKYGRTVSTRYIGAGDADPAVPIYDRPKLHKTSGEALFYALHEVGIREQRPDIEIHYESPAKRLVQTEDGTIIGVIADVNGAETAIKAKRGVVLSSGGFEYNLPMRRAFQEGPGVKGWGFYGTPDNTGDGIAMGMLVGCGLAKVAKSASRIEAAFPYGKNWDTKGLKQGVNTAVTSAPNSIVVDNYGKRYANEHIITDSTQPYRYQFYKEAVHYDMLGMIYPRVPSWSIFDESFRSTRSAVSSGAAVGYGFVPWTNDNLDAIERGWILKADTLEELADLINADPENRQLITAEELVATVNTFNEYCAAGADADFNRSPDTMGPVETAPFYAMKLYPGGPNTKGGIDANFKREALDWDGNPIPRLFTAGEISSVFKFTYQAGGNITECIVCGREAGKNVAAMEPWE